MPELFAYRARDNQGTLVAGQLRSPDSESVLRYLDSQQLIPISVEPATGKTARILESMFSRSVGLESRILFTRKFATLYRTGVPILRSLSLLAEQEHDPYFKSVLFEVHNQVEGGTALWEAMSVHPRAFGDIFVQAVKTGESSGKLDEVLKKTAEFMEREMITREEVKGAVRYPMMVGIALIGAFVLIVTFVVPKFAAVYGKFGAQLPGPTRFLIWANVVITEGWYWFVPLMILIGVGTYKFFQTDRGIEIKDYYKLKLPAIGPLFLQVAIARFSHMLSILFDSGMPMIEALGIVAQGIGNRTVASEIMKIAENFRKGRQAMERLEEGGVFPPLAIQMMSVGLETGALSVMLNELAAHYDREVMYASRRLTNVLEPIMIFALSGLVLVMALAVLLPMWNLISVFKQ